MFFISLFRHYMSSTISNEKKSDLNKIREGWVIGLSIELLLFIYLFIFFQI